MKNSPEIIENGIYYWYQVDAIGTKCWYQHGKRHRLNGPAMEYVNGDKFWYHYDKLHRLDGPAIEYADGSKYWFQNGKLHREDGPAIEYYFDTKYWFYRGKQIVCFSQQEFEKLIKLKAFW